ncbi:MAG TPA: glycosyltransferase family 4 protein [Thermoanaerobacter sp.]|nr:glycosyltransferase family 4 protein [Thermoanaerobacter sp.]
MKNIWILNHYAKPSGGRHYKFAENLIKRGYNVKIFCASTVHNSNQNMITNSRKYLYEIHNDVPFVIIRARSYKGNGAERIKNMIDYAAGLMSVSKKFDTEKPDVIYASSVHPLTWLAGYKLSKRYGAKFIAETRDLWPETFVAMGKMSKNSIPAKILYKIEKFIYQKADKLIFTFPGGKDYVESIGLDSSEVRYINNGVDLEEFNQNKTRYVLEDPDLDDDSTFKILYTGSMGIANALNNIVYAAKVLNDKGYKDIKFLLFGDGYKRKELEDYVKVNDIPNVKFKGKVDKKYIPGILSKSDLNIFTGKHIYLYKYGLSLNKMFDYFASGRPTVSNVECGYDMLEKYKCGITVKGGSAEALAEGILKFYNMPKEEYDTYCNNALKAACDFDFKILTDKLEEVILED